MKLPDPKAVYAVLLARAAKARNSFRAFFEFVMEEERTKARNLRMAPHQRVVSDFLLAHRRAVLMMPRGHSKTFLILALLLWMIGRDPLFRGAVVSATQEQAQKVVKGVRAYIESSDRLRLVFPGLAPTRSKYEPWTQSAITVDRPPGTRDATLVAMGLDGAILGSRLKAVVVDDVLTEENVNTEAGREKVIDFIDGSVLGTLDRWGDKRAWMVGTAFHPMDLLHKSTDRGWATLKMDITGHILIKDDDEQAIRVGDWEEWDHEDLVPGDLAKAPPRWVACRMHAHEPDPRQQHLLWPEEFGRPTDTQLITGRPWSHAQDCRCQENLHHLRRTVGPRKFAQMYMMVARDEAAATFQLDWVERCKQKARERHVYSLVDRYSGDGLVFVGVDLGIEIGEHNDDTAFVTFVVLADGHRQILDIDYGKYDGATKVLKIEEKVLRYNAAVVMVESNGGQKLLTEWALDRNVSLPVKAVQTTAAKAHPERGIPTIALEMFNGAWLIPNDDRGRCDERVDRLIGECVNYVPDKHTGDVLMALYLAHQGARQWGVGIGPQDGGGAGGLSSFMDR